MILRILGVSALALCAGAFVEHARAGQYFVCEDGTTIEISSAEIARAKRTNACVAKHFGLTIPATVDVKAKAGAGSKTNAVVEAKVEAKIKVHEKPGPRSNTTAEPKATPKALRTVAEQPATASVVTGQSRKSSVKSPIKSPAKAAETTAAGPAKAPVQPTLRQTKTEVAPSRSAVTERKTAHVGNVDYRRVRVINAQSPATRWFFHKR